ncbi:MAG: type IX secretion system sortase PorU [Prevotella sp.]|nr:type IX secretion system sortase PorU [Prevotella sp.]
MHIRLSSLSLLLLCVLSFGSVKAQTSYADHSILSKGRWVKVRVPQSGIYQLTDSMLEQAGFTHPEAVRVYGYGGALQPERLDPSYLNQTDDLPQVPVCHLGNRHLFHAVGPVGWGSNNARQRIRNPYSNYGYYFLTDSGDGEALAMDSAKFVQTYYPMANDYHSLFEDDSYAWYQGGRNLYERTPLTIGQPRHYELQAQQGGGQLTIVMSYSGYCEADVMVNDSTVGKMLVNSRNVTGSPFIAFPDEYSKAAVDTWTFTIKGRLRNGVNDVCLRQVSGATMRLDYISLACNEPRPLPALSSGYLPEPEVMGVVANQDLHADAPVDMVIIIPTTQLLEPQAQRLASMHEQMDGMTVRVLPADRIYNEFASGTPDASAYRRYMKMLYDRAKDISQQPRFLLLFGDGAWDNRMVLDDWSQYSPDDFLLCYESDNSVSETECYVSDDYFCVMTDGHGDDLVMTDSAQVAVGRLPVHRAEDARVLVDKIIAYRNGDNAGGWMNTICLMGDDGNDNLHMSDAEAVSGVIASVDSCYYMPKVYWDAYQLVANSAGKSYPDATRIIRQLMKQGALVMNYTGHGGPGNFSHEYVVLEPDFAEPALSRFPLWVTASCDIMPFDRSLSYIGLTAMLNPTGGAIAFFGTTRTVYAMHNRSLNMAFMHHVLSTGPDGRHRTLGEAVRMAKNDQLTRDASLKKGTNKLHFSLLGDPALALPLPSASIIIDSINGEPLPAALQASTSSLIPLEAGAIVTVSGHVQGGTELLSDFTGLATLTVLDAKQTIVGNMNEPGSSAMVKPIVFQTRPTVLFTGTDSVNQGRFRFTFPLPKDAAYSDSDIQMLVHAVSDDHVLTAHGENRQCAVVSAAQGYATEGDGPTIRCFLDSRQFADGGTTGPTPYFYAELYDADGLNVSGSGIGHDMELCVDGRMATTYNLNEYFVYDFGDCRSGAVGFRLPALTDGPHTLCFRAWDVLNNPSTVVLNFNVDPNGNQAAAAPTAINGLLDDDVMERRRQQSEGDLYDASGRYVGTFSTSQLLASQHLPRGLYIFRSKSGQAKKILLGRQ